MFNFALNWSYQYNATDSKSHYRTPDSKIHVAHMGPIWVLSVPDM